MVGGRSRLKLSVLAAVCSLVFAGYVYGGQASESVSIAPGGSSGARIDCGRGRMLTAPGFSTSTSLRPDGPVLVMRIFESIRKGRMLRDSADNDADFSSVAGRLTSYARCSKARRKLLESSGSTRQPPGEPARVSARCNRGRQVFLPGFEVRPGAQVSRGTLGTLVERFEVRGPRVIVEAKNLDPAVGGRLEAFANCARASKPAKPVRASAAVPAGELASAVARCRSGQSAQFAGFRLEPPTADDAMLITELRAIRRRVVRARAANLGGGPGELTAIAYCR